jgi:hypothetical protein
MSDSDDVSASSATPGDSAVPGAAGDPVTPTASGSERIGHGDREAAVSALKAHHAEGRLDSREYEDRALQARQARTWAQLHPLFTDLPEPHPTPTPTPPTQLSAGGEVTVGTEGPEGPITAGERHAGLVPEPWGRMIMALAPPVALILFFVTSYNWLWFLAIPIAGILVYGPDGGAGGRRRRYRRDRRRSR